MTLPSVKRKFSTKGVVAVSRSFAVVLFKGFSKRLDRVGRSGQFGSILFEFKA